MKIISGKLKGRIINGYDIEGTRPTMDRVKESVFATIQNKIKFDLVFLDPPYKMHVCKDIMQYMRKNDLLSPNALIISEVSENYFEDEEEGFLLIKFKKYGDKYVFIYKNTL